jgi:quinol monooxygenase YgiN
MKFSRRQFLHLGANVVALPAVFRIANAQTESDRYFYATNYLEVVPISESETSRVLRQLADASRREQGVFNFEIAQMVFPTNHFVIFGAWKDQQAYDAHLAAAHTKQGIAALASQLLAPIDNRR